MNRLLVPAFGCFIAIYTSAQDISVRGSGELRSDTPQVTQSRLAPKPENAGSSSQSLTNADVIAMAKGGLPETTIILAIRQKATRFDTSPQALLTLKNAGVSSSVIDAMLNSKEERAKSTVVSNPDSGLLTNEKVLELLKSGQSDDAVIEAIKRGPTKFDFSSEGVSQLLRGHVSPAVMQAISYSYGMNLASGIRSGKVVGTSHISVPPGEKLPSEEVQAALSGSGRNRWVEIQDMGLMAAQGAQVPAITLLMPQAIIATRSDAAKEAFRHYEPSDEDQRNALTIIARGYAGETMAGGCTDITRVVLLSSESGGTIEEAYLSEAVDETWRNGFGATDSCQRLRAKFSMLSVKRIKSAARNGEFFVAVFSGASKTKVYKIKNKHQAKLGL
jgi:hypothetical protein